MARGPPAASASRSTGRELREKVEDAGKKARGGRRRVRVVDTPGIRQLHLVSSPDRTRILVVDDEEAILETMAFTFEDDYEVLTSTSPRDGARR